MTYKVFCEEDSFPMEICTGKPLRIKRSVPTTDKYHFLFYRVSLPKSVKAFALAYKVFFEEDSFPMEIRIQAVEKSVFTSDKSHFLSLRLPVAKQVEAFTVAYKVFREEDGFPMEIRRQAIERVCIPLMRLCSTQALVEFFKANVKEITGIIDAKTIKVKKGSILANLHITITLSHFENGCDISVYFMLGRVEMRMLSDVCGKICPLYT